MSQALETLYDTPDRYEVSDAADISQPALRADEISRLCNRAALDMVTESIVCFSASTSRLVHLNRAACQSLGYTQHQLRGMSLLDIAPHATRENLTEIYRRAVVSENEEARVRTVYRHRSGSLIPVNCTLRALRMLPENILVAVSKDTSQRSSLNSPRVSAAYRDSLTQLPNRAWLWRQLDSETRTAWPSGYQFAVLFIDVDRFKVINDSYGHLAGDEVLQAVARRLQASIRPNDALARYGGDEFVVIMKDVDGEEDIRRIAERIGRCSEAVGECRGGKESRASVTVSIGAAIFGGNGSSPVEAFDRADRAMYRAKALGRNGHFVIDESPKNSDQSAGIRA